MAEVSNKKTAAVVVSYFPDAAILTQLLTAISPQVDRVLLMDNGGTWVVLDSDEVKNVAFTYVNLGGNLGLGAALNRGIRLAVDGGAGFVVLFDQDSLPNANHVETLRNAHLELMNRDLPCAAIGPVFFDRREGEKVYFPFYQDGKAAFAEPSACPASSRLVPTDFLITSGMMVRTEVWLKDLQFDEWLFVDQTDNEWCFRVRHAGYRVFGCRDVEMGHSLSDAVPIRFLGLTFLRYSPLRRYFYFRGTTYLVFSGGVPIAWKVRFLSSLVLKFFANAFIDPHPLKSLWMMSKGALEGVHRGIVRRGGR